MRTLIPTILFAFGLIAANAQENEVLLLQLKAGYSPDVAFRTLGMREKDDASAEAIIELRNDYEQPRFGSTAFVSACFNLNRMIGVEAGLQYSLKGYETEKRELTLGQFIDPRYGFVYNIGANGIPEEAKFFYNFHYIGIPVKANFSFGSGKLRFVAGVGFVTEFLVSATQTSLVSYADGSKERETQKSQYDYRTVNFSPQLSVGADYRINQRMGVLVEPTFRFGTVNIIDAPVNAYLWSCGLNLSYYFGL